MLKLSPVEKVYKAFYDGRKDRLYYKQVKDLTKMSDSSLQNALSNMKDELIVDKQKGNTFYSLPKSSTTKINFTRFDLLRIDSLGEDVKRSINRLLKEDVDGVAFILLFGSASRNQEKGNSDIDILIVMDNADPKYQEKVHSYTKKHLDTVLEKIDALNIHPFSAFYTTSENFSRLDDRLIKEAALTGFCIIGNMRYYELMLKDEEDY